MLRRIFRIILVLAVVVLVYAAFRPGTLHVERTAHISAAPEKIYPQIQDFHSWRSWSPYEKLDPLMTRKYSGAESGKGAVYEWKGNNSVGEGRMEITNTSEPLQVTIKLDFIKPFEGHNVAEFVLVPENDGTVVIWKMDGPAPYLVRLMGVFVDMDNMIGKDFETGLANLKTITEDPRPI
jgi:hypothetical protein